MKTDVLVEKVSGTVEYVQTHTQNLVLYGVTAIALIAVVAGSYFFYNKRSDSANEALGSALRIYHSPIRPISLNDQPDDPSFQTVQARDDQALREFQNVASEYSMLRPGKMARYYVGLTQLDRGNLPEAEKELNAAVSAGDSYVAPLAKLALASVYEREKKSAEAEQAYRALVDHPSDSVPKVTAQLALASFLRPTKPAEADKIFKDLEASKPDQDIANVISKAKQESAK